MGANGRVGDLASVLRGLTLPSGVLHCGQVTILAGFNMPGRQGLTPAAQDSYLVDSASSHMLVSKIKPCMSKYKQYYSETANGSLNQLSFI